MSKVTLIVGLPGSGKTHLARTLVRETPALMLFDDINNLSRLKMVLDGGCNAVITDPHLCFIPNRKNAADWLTKNGVTEISWIFFENNPDACRNNVKGRSDGRDVERFLNSMWKYYVIPVGTPVREVWQKAA